MTSETDAEFVERMAADRNGPIYEAEMSRLFALARRGAEAAARIEQLEAALREMAQDDQFARIQKLEAEALVLRAAMAKVTEALNQGRIVSLGGVTGMTMDAMMRNSVYNRVPCGPIEDAIAMLDEADLCRVPPPPKGETE